MLFLRLSCARILWSTPFLRSFSMRRTLDLNPPTRLNGDPNEQRLIAIVKSICPRQQTRGPFRGRVLTCDDGRDAIQALKNRGSFSIVSVPVDSRENARQMLLHSIDRPGVSNRRDLLSSAAFGGSGKTVLLYFNAQWFVDATQGIAVVVTFNKDQQNLDGVSKLRTMPEVGTAIAVRVVHRLLRALNCPQDTADFECGSSGSVAHTLRQTMDPLKTSINVVRAMLDARKETKFLLCVDELAKCIHPKSDNFAMEDALQLLTGRLDTDKSFFLAVSALGADAIVNLATGSNRRLLLQPLGPLWFTEDFHPDSKPLLPYALKPFYNEEARALLPDDASAVALYLKLTTLMATAAGHPRSMETLFKGLGAFKPSAAAAPVLSGGNKAVTPAEQRAAGKAFVAELATWLERKSVDPSKSEFDQTKAAVEQRERPRELMNLVPDAQGAFRHLFLRNKDLLLSDALEDLALYSACPFQLPRLPSETNVLKTVLGGISHGFCQLVPADGGTAHG